MHGRAETAQLDLLGRPGDHVGIVVLPFQGYLGILASVDENVEGACMDLRAFPQALESATCPDKPPTPQSVMESGPIGIHFSSMTGKNVTLAVICRMIAWISAWISFSVFSFFWWVVELPPVA